MMRACSPTARIKAARSACASPRVDQQARAAHGRERHRREELRVVLESVLRISIRPGEIEHELAARMALAIQRHRAHQPPLGVRARSDAPASNRFRRGASGFLEREQEFMSQKGLCGAPDERIPLGRARLRRCSEGAGPARRGSRVRGARLEVQLGVETLQILVCVERGHAAGARRSDGLPVDVIRDIPAANTPDRLVAVASPSLPPLTTI